MTSIFVCRLPSRVSYLVVWLSFLCYCNCINKSLWVDGQNWMCVSCSVFVTSTALFGLTFSVTEKTHCQSRREEDVLYFLSYTKTKRIMLFFFSTLLSTLLFPELHSRRSRVFNLLLCLKVHRFSLSLSLLVDCSSFLTERRMMAFLEGLQGHITFTPFLASSGIIIRIYDRQSK